MKSTIAILLTLCALTWGLTEAVVWATNTTIDHQAAHTIITECAKFAAMTAFFTVMFLVPALASR